MIRLLLVLSACTSALPESEGLPRHSLGGHVWQVAQRITYSSGEGTPGAQWHPEGSGDSVRVCLDFTGPDVLWWDSHDGEGNLGAWSDDGPLDSWGALMTVGDEPWDVYAVPDAYRDGGDGLWRVEGPASFGLYPGEPSCDGV